MRELETRFPKGLDYAIVYDTTPFIRESVDEVFHTLRDAVILVAIVVLLFLQDWKALLLPVIDVAVSLVGTFAVMSLMGFTLNNLTLFGLVLAIGIVVDDAIVVLENIERWLDKGLPVREATIKAMNEITGPILAITLVLSSVFLPSAFLGGITGQFFRQFALTIAVSMIISADQCHDDDAGAGGLDLRRPQARRSTATRARRRCRGGASACSAGWRPCGCWRRRWAPGWACPRGEGGEAAPGGLTSHAADVGRLRRPLPPRRGRRRGARLVRHPAGELGPGPVLPRLQLGLRPGDAGLRQDRGLVPPPQRRSCCWSTSA